MHSTCYLQKRLAQGFRQILDVRTKKISQWFSYQWTLLMICLVHKKLAKKLNPHNQYDQFSFPIKFNNIPIQIALTSSYKARIWRFDRNSLRRLISHHNKIGEIHLSLADIVPKINKEIKLAQRHKKLPKLHYLPWIKEKLLNPQNLLAYGKKILRIKKMLNFGIEPQVTQDKKDFSLTIRMANIRTLTKEKLETDRALESLMDFSPDVYLYVESKNKLASEKLSKYRQLYHSIEKEGQGGTTVIINKKVQVSFSETNIPDTVILVLHKEKSTILLAGTYMSHRDKNKSQKLGIILETMSKLTERYQNISILLFGDFNMPESSLQNILKKYSIYVAKLGLKLINDYNSPPRFSSSNSND